MTVSGTASDRATPISVPTTMPTTAPNVDTMIASQRTVRRVWRLFIPTARIRPISRVRSNTPRASVIEMPSTAMTIENAGRGRGGRWEAIIVSTFGAVVGISSGR